MCRTSTFLSSAALLLFDLWIPGVFFHWFSSLGYSSESEGCRVTARGPIIVAQLAVTPWYPMDLHPVHSPRFPEHPQSRRSLGLAVMGEVKVLQV